MKIFLCLFALGLCGCSSYELTLHAAGSGKEAAIAGGAVLTGVTTLLYLRNQATAPQTVPPITAQEVASVK